jgi:hypothetical protein
MTPFELIEFGSPLRLTTHLIITIPICIYLSMFALYYFQGRFAFYSPTISETATDYPNYLYSRSIFRNIASMATSGRLVFSWWLMSVYRPSFFLSFLIVILPVSGFLADIGLGESPVNTASERHFLFATQSFSAGIGFEVATLAVTARKAGWFRNLARATLIGCGITALLVCAQSDKIVDRRTEDTLSMIGEYVYLIELELFCGSFAWEVATVRVVAAVDFENRGS